MRRHEDFRSHAMGEHLDSTKRWNDVPRGTMDEVGSSGPLDRRHLMASPIKRLFRLVFESHTGRAVVPIPKRSASLRATSTLHWWIGLKALDPNRPIREGTTPCFQDQ